MAEAERPAGRLEGEENVAKRIRMERSARQWSTAVLADRMSEAGFPINQSAVWRIESGDPPRRVNLDEAIGFARVFEISLEDLIGPPEAGENAHLQRLLAEYADASVALRAAREQMGRARVALDAYAEAHPSLAEAMTGMIRTAEDLHPDGVDS
ncbi:helix-turn-helix transcriptional regulator [Streptacidiphilus sp. EB129]|uniref:helix-turn-helix transcriptional regulator n=1 Tax=Streptacidiphilus sp. EB129 TaxID=3156262 RepID=UPI003515C987